MAETDAPSVDANDSDDANDADVVEGHVYELGYEPGLDGLRAFAIIGVVLYHATNSAALPNWFRGGPITLTVFFTLSGFLIMSILLRDVGGDRSVDLGRFWSRRIRRLAPAQLLMVVATVAASELGWMQIYRADSLAATWSVTNWRMTTSPLPSFVQTSLGPLGQTWSLAVEEQFYVAVALFTFLASRTARPVRNLAILFGAITVMSIVLANTITDWLPHLEFGLDMRAGELAIGCLLAIFMRRHGSVLVGRERLANLAGAVAVVGLVLFLLYADWTPPWLLRGGFTIVAITTAVAIVGVLAHGTVDRVLSVNPLVLIGRWSYALYLVHWPVLVSLTPNRTGLDRWSLLALQLVVMFVLSIAMHLLVEQPIRNRTDLSTRTTVIAWLGALLVVTAICVIFATPTPE
jgi:peptidoglycan/LPS O-acetylase OafA/YrhL